MKIGYMLSCEQFTPAELLDQARRARAAGFDALSISDHFHPWNEEQGNSPFVWSVIGALSAAVPGTPVCTMVSCPTFRVHPVIVAHAAATAAVMLDGRFALGVGSGENLNEHVTGLPWPAAGERLQRMREAIELMRRLWDGGNVNFEGRFYRAVNARLYTVPEEPPPVYVSGFGPAAIRLAAEVGDGVVTMDPELLGVYSDSGGRGVRQTAFKASFSRDVREARDVAHRTWATEALPGQLNQELATPGMFESASTLVGPEQVSSLMPCGPDPRAHLDALESRLAAGFDEVYVQQVGRDMDGFFSLYATEILPQARQPRAA
jgi:G6PDH family F420-dependent oxidoreductase